MTLRCVIVDDNPAFLRAACDLLERQGMTVAGTASSGDEARSLMEAPEPDVVLLDIDLGSESGFQLARRLTGSRIILISAHDGADYAELIAASPAIGFLPKRDLTAAAIQGLLATATGRRGT